MGDEKPGSYIIIMSLNPMFSTFPSNDPLVLLLPLLLLYVTNYEPFIPILMHERSSKYVTIYELDLSLKPGYKQITSIEIIHKRYIFLTASPLSCIDTNKIYFTLILCTIP